MGVPGRRNDKSKCPELGVCLVGSRGSKVAQTWSRLEGEGEISR